MEYLAWLGCEPDQAKPFVVKASPAYLQALALPDGQNTRPVGQSGQL